ncbi:MAG: hypothetical protein ACI9WU_000623 [Myxococcota bacterium]|jgi:hypothetical protein
MILEAAWRRNACGGHDLSILAGGSDLDALDRGIRSAFSRRMSGLEGLHGFSGEITVAVLPRCTPDTAESRRWRMKLQRDLREQVSDRALSIKVEYERWR